MKCNVLLRRMRVHALHGVLPQERVIGADFYVSITAMANVDETAVKEDRLEGVVDYSLLTRVVQEEMATASALLENVAYRIGKRILGEEARIESLTVRIEKENPPLGIAAEGVGVEITLRNN